MKRNDEIAAGIAAYVHEQTVLLRLIRKRKRFTESEFDELFYGREWRKPRMRFCGITGDSFILGGLGGERDQWLHLLQLMVSSGTVHTSTEEGAVVYSLTRPPPRPH